MLSMHQLIMLICEESHQRRRCDVTSRDTYCDSHRFSFDRDGSLKFWKLEVDSGSSFSFTTWMAHLLRAYKYVRLLHFAVSSFKRFIQFNYFFHFSSSLLRRPMVTQCITAAVLFGTGDVLAQQAVEGKGRNHDVRKIQLDSVRFVAMLRFWLSVRTAWLVGWISIVFRYRKTKQFFSLS